MAKPRPVDDDTINLVHQFEGLPELAVANIHPYVDPVGIWTIGRGHAISPDGRFVRGDAGLDQVKTIITCSYVAGRLLRHWAVRTVALSKRSVPAIYPAKRQSVRGILISDRPCSMR